MERWQDFVRVHRDGPGYLENMGLFFLSDTIAECVWRTIGWGWERKACVFVEREKLPK